MVLLEAWGDRRVDVPKALPKANKSTPAKSTPGNTGSGKLLPTPAPVASKKTLDIGSQPAWQTAAGFPAMRPWAPAPTGTTKSGVPKAITQNFGPQFEADVDRWATPTSSERQILSTLGWQLPDEATNAPAVSPFKTDDPTALASYKYLPEQEEIDRVQELYKGMPGFTAADKQPGTPAESRFNPQTGSLTLTPAENVEAPIVNEVQSAALTWDEYDRLSEDQRKAVDFNTLLVRAREQDLSHSHFATDDQRKAYDEEVKTIFGDAGGSKTYAPNTVALLKQIDFTAVGQDLDEYLSLERAVTADQLKNFTLENSPEFKQLGEGTSYETVRSHANQEAASNAAVAKSADAVTKAMTDANNVLENFYATMEQARTPLLQTYGGVAVDPSKRALGFPYMGQTYTEGNEADDRSIFLENAYATAASGNIDEVWAALDGASDEEKQMVVDYLNERSLQETRWGRPEGLFTNTDDVKYLTPEATRESIGFGG